MTAAVRKPMTVVFLVAALVSCGGDDPLLCAGMLVCPSGTTCIDDLAACVTTAQIAACSGKPDGIDCTTPVLVGICLDEVCLQNRCGDGVIRAGEQCDMGALGSATDCLALGYYHAGPLTCAADCVFDTSACAGYCGDAVVQAGIEVCDGDTTTCQSLGFVNGGAVACTSACTWNTAGCSN